ncbi:MAG: sugar transferase [Candidatus Hydrogenedens sp.]|nr:sugar transferase [Candidatus Hydrogenedens sp.]
MDLSAALGGLVLLSPLLAALALAVRLGSPGPALYRQERQGRGGKPFHVVKFRTMAQGAEDRTGPVLAEEDDPRVTPTGRWLRRTRLDELPQLWNVIRGEMSLVGPRPERPAFADAHLAEEPLYRHRLLARPGMTGLAQIHGRYDTDYRQKLRYDLLYIGNMTLAADLRILAATARIVLTGRGAR